jgi:hypothetical protein
VWQLLFCFLDVVLEAVVEVEVEVVVHVGDVVR